MPRVELTAPKLADLVTLDDADFRQVFSTSPIKRIGRDRFVRNVLIAIGNSGEQALAAKAEALLGDASPLVRAMAVWALWRLFEDADFQRLSRRHRQDETDAGVLAEWDRTGRRAPENAATVLAAGA
jgi:epoxyqueuosine reductase